MEPSFSHHKTVGGGGGEAVILAKVGKTKTSFRYLTKTYMANFLNLILQE